MTPEEQASLKSEIRMSLQASRHAVKNRGYDWDIADAMDSIWPAIIAATTPRVIVLHGHRFPDRRKAS